MTGRTGSRGLALAAFVAALLASVLRLGVDAEVLLWAAPVLLLVAPLALGRFVGEGALDAGRRRRAARPPRRRAVRAVMPRRTPRVVGAHGCLLAFRLAERGPPAALLAR
jgi:hypothetical protein